MSDEGGHSPGGLACSTVWALGDFHGWEALQKIPELSQKHRFFSRFLGTVFLMIFSHVGMGWEGKEDDSGFKGIPGKLGLPLPGDDA
uniref:Uncharacterized protein n=1 Tax=Oryza nivara TaxID=4536 RepID=A0A0E0I4E9_ORYNI